jgi:hypothetical protein
VAAAGFDGAAAPNAGGVGTAGVFRPRRKRYSGGASVSTAAPYVGGGGGGNWWSWSNSASL